MRKKLMLAAVAMALQAGEAFAAAPSDPLLLKSLVAADWPAVATRAEAVEHPSPAVRILAGHAYLNGDRGNDALCAFAGATGKTDRSDWLSWTSEVVAAHPGAATAHYVHGDALAREERWADARAAFNRALKLAPGNALFLNARAVAAAAAGDWQEAKRDLRAAAKSPTKLLDVDVNQGLLAILQRTDAKAADNHFKAVLERSPDHAIALIGRGAAGAAVRDWRSAEEFYAKAADAAGCIPLAVDNALLAQAAELDEQRLAVLQLAQDDPGTSILLQNVEAGRRRTQDAIQVATSASASEGKIKALQDADKRMSNAWNPALAVGAGALEGASRLPGIRNTWLGPVLNAAGSGMRQVVQENQNKIQQNQSAISGLQGKTFTFSLPGQTGGQPSSTNNDVGGLWAKPPPSALDAGRWPVVLWPVLLYHMTPTITD